MTRHFDWLAPWYERVISPPNSAPLVERLALPAAGWLLDAGGGTGRATILLRPYVDRVVVADLSWPMLREAHVKGGLAAVRASVLDLPHADDRFARILVMDAFHHFPAQDRALAELLRVLHPGGRLVIQEPDITHPLVKGIALAERAIGMQSRFLSARDIVGMARGLGAVATVVAEAGPAVSVVIEKRG